MLLHIVAFTGDISPHQPSVAQSHPGDLAFTGVGLLGLGRSDLDADALHLRAVLQLGRGELAGGLGLAAAAADLVVGGIACGAGAEAAGCGGEDRGRRGRRDGDARRGGEDAGTGDCGGGEGAEFAITSSTFPAHLHLHFRSLLLSPLPHLSLRPSLPPHSLHPPRSPLHRHLPPRLQPANHPRSSP